MCVRFEVLRVMTIKMKVVWDVTPCIWVEIFGIRSHSVRSQKTKIRIREQEFRKTSTMCGQRRLKFRVMGEL
jgi:hypothetical protein